MFIYYSSLIKMSRFFLNFGVVGVLEMRDVKGRVAFHSPTGFIAFTSLMSETGEERKSKYKKQKY